MATSYTPSLRLWLGTPGDPAIRNSWGTDLNENFTLLENAILGTASVNIAGLSTYTLTTANGAADQAREYIQSYTGALTGNCTVTLPSVPKIGWAQNLTTGGHSVILTTGGSGTTLTVPPDTTYYWYQVDNTGNVTTPRFTLPSLTLASLTVSGNATIGGTLGVTGASTFTGTATFNGTTVTVTHNATVGGTLGVTGATALSSTLSVGGLASLNGSAGIPNNIGFFAKDTGGTYRNVFFYGNDNNLYLDAGTGGHLKVNDSATSVTWVDYSASGVLFNISPVLPNNVAIQAKDTSGTAHNLLYYGGNNSVVIVSGTGTAGVLITNPAVNATWLSVTGSGITIPNGASYSSYDTSGVAQSVLVRDGANNTDLRAGSGGVINLTNQSGSFVFLNVNGSGIILPNQGGVYGDDTGGTPRAMLLYGSDNNVYTRGGTGGLFNVTDSASTIVWMSISSGTGTLHGSNIVTDNGGTYGINITGSASFATNATNATNASFASSATNATNATNASNVPWSGISGVPSDISSINQNLTTGSDVTFHEISATYGFQCRPGINAPGQTDVFNINWTGSAAQMWIDSTFLGNFAYTSDRRIKQGIVDGPSGALDRVLSWRVVEFEYRAVGIFKSDGVRHLGFIADELQKATPWAVDGEADAVNGYGEIAPQTLRPIPMIAELTGAVQKLSTMVTDLLDEVGILKRRLKAAGL